VLLSRGFHRVRVRVKAGRARIEVGPEEVARLSAATLRSEVESEIRSLGFDSVTVDPLGYGARPAGGGRSG
jgi:PP-loop superfamily ATP-utilizing enzyme